MGTASAGSRGINTGRQPLRGISPFLQDNLTPGEQGPFTLNWKFLQRDRFFPCSIYAAPFVQMGTAQACHQIVSETRANPQRSREGDTSQDLKPVLCVLQVCLPSLCRLGVLISLTWRASWVQCLPHSTLQVFPLSFFRSLPLRLSGPCRSMRLCPVLL